MNVDISADTRCVTDGCSAPGMWPASNSAGERTSMVSTRGLHLKASKFPIFGRFRRFLCLLAYCCAFYTYLRYPLMWIPSPRPSLPQLRQVRTTFRAARQQRRQRQRHWRGAQGPCWAGPSKASRKVSAIQCWIDWNNHDLFRCFQGFQNFNT